MNVNTNGNYQEEHSAITMTPFVQAKMGLKSGQTLLKINNYSIACIVYRLSSQDIILLASLSANEIAYFSNYANSISGLTLIFQNTPTTLMKIFARCILTNVSTMAKKESVALLSIQLKPCPPALTTILNNYAKYLNQLEIAYETFSNQPITVNAEISKKIGYNNYCILTLNNNQYKIALFKVASKFVDFLIPPNGPQITRGNVIQLRLFFQSFQFNIKGQVAEITKYPTGIQKANATIEFSPELVSIIKEYYDNEAQLTCNNIKTTNQ